MESSKPIRASHLPAQGNLDSFVSLGGGLFTLLDDLANDRATVDDNARIRGLVRSNWEDRFGQGGQVSFRKFEIDG
jgi:hypothetical protein